MRYIRLSGIDRDLSILTYGTPGPAFSGKREAFACYDMAWEAGFRTFDTAHSYGAGEATLGAWLKDRGHRSQAVILDKGYNPGQKGSPDARDPEVIRRQVEESLRRLQTDRVELYTESYAREYHRLCAQPGGLQAGETPVYPAIAPFVEAAKVARECGLGLNAGHDLSLENLAYFHEQIPWCDEVSIGHALISDALYLGIEETIRRYLGCLK